MAPLRKLRSVHGDRVTSRSDHAEIDDHGHLVQFYESEDFLAESVRDFMVAGLRKGESAVIVATKEHRQRFDELIGDSGLDLQDLRNKGRYVLLDAGETLSRFVVDGEPEAALFSAAVGSVIARAAQVGGGIRIFGEMVALLWADGNVTGAIRLEELWNELAEAHPFSLLCAYPIEGFGSDTDGFHHVCELHSRAIPTESYMALPDADGRLRAVTELQHRTKMSEQEHRRQALALNARVVQGLAVAQMALEMKRYDLVETSLARTLKLAASMASDLLDGESRPGGIEPGTLRSGETP